VPPQGEHQKEQQLTANRKTTRHSSCLVVFLTLGL